MTFWKVFQSIHISNFQLGPQISSKSPRCYPIKMNTNKSIAKLGEARNHSIYFKCIS